MFEPQFSLTEAFKGRLKSIDEANKHLRHLFFPHKEMEQLKQEAIVTSISLIVHPEYPRVGIGWVVRTLESQRPHSTPGNDTDRVILNIHEILRQIHNFSATKGEITEEAFIHLYYLLKNYSQETDITKSGVVPYRNAPKDVRESPQKKIYTAADHREVPSSVTDLFDWLRFESKSVHSIIKAIIAYFQILIIRPFFDDNCKMAWFLFVSILYENDIDFGGYVSLEEGIFRDRDNFQQDVLHLVATTYNSKDFSRSNFQPYIIYILPFLENTILERRSQLDKVHKRVVGEMLQRANMNERQKKALTFVLNEGRITNRKYKELNDVHTRKRAWEELSHLVRCEILKNVEQGRNAAYKLSPIMTPETVLKHL